MDGSFKFVLSLRPLVRFEGLGAEGLDEPNHLTLNPPPTLKYNKVEEGTCQKAYALRSQEALAGSRLRVVIVWLATRHACCFSGSHDDGHRSTFFPWSRVTPTDHVLIVVSTVAELLPT